MRSKLFLVCLLLLPLVSWGQKHTISGYIRDAENGEALIGANVFDKLTLNGTSTNVYGFFSLTLPQDSVQLVFSYVGYEPQVKNILLNKDFSYQIELNPAQVLDEVVVSAERNAAPIQNITQMSTIHVPIAQIKSMPALLGEVDVMKVLQLLPGVSGGTEGSSGLYVRGGGPDQNLILLDGVPVYNASHLFGFFSVFNADAINNVDIIKGGFPARYGGRLSSVLDIQMKEGNMKKFSGAGSLGLISSKLTLEGPIAKDKASFIISGRRTYLDVLARPIIRLSTQGNSTFGYYFYDLNGKVNYRISPKDRVYVSAYLGDDRAFASDKVSYIANNSSVEDIFNFNIDWGNITTAVRWNHELNPKLFSNVTATYSRYRFNTGTEQRTTITPVSGDPEEEFFSFGYYSGIEDWSGKVEFDYLPSPNHYVRFGSNLIYHTFSPGALGLQSNNELDTTFGAPNIYSYELANYIEDDWKVTDKLKVNLGLHYLANLVRNTWYTSLQPRFAARYLISPTLSAKASYARMTQYLHLLTNAGLGLPTDLWVPATDIVEPQQSHQVAAGLASQYKDLELEVSVEGYYKTMDNLIEYKPGASFLNTADSYEDKVEIGRGRSYGGEVFIQKQFGDFSGWVGYTLSWTERQFDNLNFGAWYPYRYDRRHDLSVAAVYKHPSKWDFSAAFVYATGNAISLPTTVYQGVGFRFDGDFQNVFYPELEYYASRNGFRQRAYHRLDLSASHTKETKWGERTWNFSVYNAYSRQNPFFMLRNTDENGNPQIVQYSLFPIIPSISYQFKF